tara:strand:- start:79 stop:465 length:387 start_codon:yes stop_codon:yes gene_type:complete
MTKQKNTPKKRGRPRKNQPEMEIVDGKSDIEKAENLESLIGIAKRDPFQLNNGSDFENSLTSMNLTEMQEIAVRAGVFPSGTKTTLKGKLLKEYKARAKGKYKKATVERTAVKPGSKAADDLLSLINE